MAVGTDTELRVVVNSAIDDIIKFGPNGSNVSSWCREIQGVLNKVSMSSSDAASLVEDYHRAYFKKVDSAHGIPLHSVHSDNPYGEVDTVVGSETYGEIRARATSALERVVSAARADSDVFRSREIREALDVFENWANSVPSGGSKEKVYRLNAADVRGAIKSVASWDKRFFISHRRDFTSELDYLFKAQRGAIAARWEWYRYPEDDPHEDLNGKIFLVRGSWAHERGLIKTEGMEFLDERALPGVANCTCSCCYLNALRALPLAMLTEEGVRLLQQNPVESDKSMSGSPARGKSWFRRIFAK